MKRSLDRSLSNLFSTCQEYYIANDRGGSKKRRGEPYKYLKKALTATLHAMATLHSVKYPGWIVDKDHPGYLLRLDPPMFFRVPYHVLPSFPSGRELDSLWHLSRTVRAGSRSVIALSGSNVLRRIFEIVNDVDFCEYVFDTDSAAFENIYSNLDGDDNVACMRLVLLDRNWGIRRKWEYPWGNDRPNSSYLKSVFDASDCDRSLMKVDYVGVPDNFDEVYEITNVMIAVDGDGRSASHDKTFAAQEAPMVAIDWLPNQMGDPVEMGRYINWLSESITHLRVRGDLLKCLKRCASLARVIFSSDVTDQIIELTRDSPLLLEQKRYSAQKLVSVLEPYSDGRSVQFKRILANRIAQLDKELEAEKWSDKPDKQHEFSKGVSEIAARLIEIVSPGESAKFGASRWL